MKYFDEAATSAILSVSRRTLQHWRETGEGPAYTRIGARRVLYAETAIQTYAATRTYPHRGAELSKAA
jgi:hypothetical protein